MSVQRPIALMGMPRSGKSTLSKRLKADWHVVDSDKALSVWLNKTPDQMIQEQGLEAFRNSEKKWLAEICIPSLAQYKNYLLSTGGGMPCIPGVIEQLNQHFITVHLYLPKTTWLKRMNDPNQPAHALSKQYTLAELERLYDRRQAYYQQSQATLEIAQTPSKDAEALRQLLRRF